MLTDQEYSRNVSEFCVGKHTSFSDHNPITGICNIKACYNDDHREEGKVEVERIYTELENNNHRFENIVNYRNHTTQEAKNDVVSPFSDTLLNIAGPFRKTVTNI